MNRQRKGKIGIFIIKFALLILFVDLWTKGISTFIGMLICGERYMCMVDGVVGDCSCGFNTDKELYFILMSMIIIGIALFLSSEKISLHDEKSMEDEANE